MQPLMLVFVTLMLFQSLSVYEMAITFATMIMPLSLIMLLKCLEIGKEAITDTAVVLLMG